MTVATVVAGLLPIMWSTRPGAEVMKPLATPVLGGMLSSLAHVLIVTPVIFCWLRERQLGLHTETPAVFEDGRYHAETGGLEVPGARPRAGRLTRRTALGAGLTAFLVIAAALWWTTSSRPRQPGLDARAIQRVPADDLQIVLLSATGSLQQGRTGFWLEFRDRNGMLVDAGDVRGSATMTMPGMAMSGGLQVRRTAVPGRYEVTGEFAMAGAWQMTLEWDRPAGPGAVKFEGTVQ
jgi:Cu(I)/Ag(I) efflux system membrane protein CusA/SilA